MISEGAYRILCRLPEWSRRCAIRLANHVRLARVARQRTPSTLVFFVTSRCNAACSHCFFHDGVSRGDNGLTLEQIRTMAASLRGTLKCVVLTGGEPFLRDDLPEVCRIFRNAGMTRHIVIPTNGLATTRTIDHVRTIMSSVRAPVTVQVSLDGMGENHDRIRGVPGAFERVCQTLRGLATLSRMRGTKLELAILTVVSKANICGYGELMEFVAREFTGIRHEVEFVRSVDASVFALPSGMWGGDGGVRRELLLDTDEMDGVCQVVRERLFRGAGSLSARIALLRLEYAAVVAREKRRIVPCFAGTLDGVIYWDGSIALCEFTRSVGKLDSTGAGFHSVWWGEDAEVIRRGTKRCACTHACNLANGLLFDSEALCRLTDRRSWLAGSGGPLR